jgi:hypothetical protein
VRDRPSRWRRIARPLAEVGRIFQHTNPGIQAFLLESTIPAVLMIYEKPAITHSGLIHSLSRVVHSGFNGSGSLFKGIGHCFGFSDWIRVRLLAFETTKMHTNDCHFQAFPLTVLGFHR